MKKIDIILSGLSVPLLDPQKKKWIFMDIIPHTTQCIVVDTHRHITEGRTCLL